MFLDIRTLLVAAALAIGVCAVARFLLYRLHPGMPGLGHWAMAGGLGALALVQVPLHGALPSERLPAVLTAVLILAGYTVSWDGHRRFTGGKPLPPALPIILPGCGVLPSLLPGLSHPLAALSIANAVLVASVSGLIARELHRAAAASGREIMRAMAWLYAVNCVFFLGRAVAVGFEPEAVGTVERGGVAVLAILWGLCLVVAATLGMVLMASERLQAELDQQASRDPLTGVLNRRAFASLAEREIARARRVEQPLSVLMMDLDHFKQINDRFGHAGGDAVLRRFVAVAERVLRREDLFCRFGGEEFVALLPGSTAAQALAAAERLRTAFAEEAAASIPAGTPPFAFTVSVGVGELVAGEDLEGVLHRADAALYRAKAAGRNRSELAAAGPFRSPAAAIA